MKQLRNGYEKGRNRLRNGYETAKHCVFMVLFDCYYLLHVKELKSFESGMNRV